MPKIALIGPGAIGGSLAALLLENPDNQIVICARTRFETLEITHQGQTEVYHPKVYTDPNALHPVDWIILATKTYQVDASATWVLTLTGTGTRLAVVQNGVEHLSRLSKHFPSASIVPVIIDCPIERSAPGKLVRHGNVSMHVPKSSNGSEFAALFTHPAVTVHQTDDWKTAAWRKLALNCAGAICALVDRPANVAANPTAARVMRSLIQECIAVADAEGCKIDPALIETIIASQAAAPEGAMNSLHADFVHNRPMEWDARNGVIARLGEQHQIPTPYNRMAADLLSLLEKP